MSKPELSVLAALALELSPGAEPGRLALAVDDAGELAGLVARDLARLVPDAATLDLAMVAGLFDPAELLRPGYPVHAELGRLAARAPGAAGGRIIGFGAGQEGLPAGLARGQLEFLIADACRLQQAESGETMSTSLARSRNSGSTPSAPPWR